LGEQFEDFESMRTRKGLAEASELAVEAIFELPRRHVQVFNISIEYGVSTSQRPMSVGDLAAQLPVTRPAVSQHLKVLKDAGLVSEQPIGTRRVYRLDAAGVAALREQRDDFWDRALSGSRSTVERSRKSKK
jgi:DNA-binding transcriptional ArsR family regulator